MLEHTRGGKNICRFNFPLPPLPETLILEPLNDDCYEKNPNVQQHFQKICELLNDAQLLQTIKTFDDLLQKLELTEES